MTQNLRQDCQTDREFSALSPGCFGEDYEALEADIRASGCRTPLFVWEGRIVDGHTRYEICTKWCIPFQTRSLSFPAREDAVLWICQRQLKKERLPDMLRRYLIGRLFTAEKDIAYRTQGPAADRASFPHPRIQTGTRLGEQYGVSMHTIYKAGTLAAAIDHIRCREPELAGQILCGQIAISYENVSVLARLSRDELRRLNRQLADSHKTHLILADLKPAPPQKRSVGRPKKNSGIQTAIKEMPPYDPDAGIKSLGYTIPSWIGSIGRTFAQTDFSAVSPEAQKEIRRQLRALCETAEAMLRAADGSGKTPPP